MKLCTKCGLNKPKSEFNKRAALAGGYASNCKICTATMSKEFNRSIEGVVNSSYSHQVMNSKKRGHPLPSYTKTELFAWCSAHPLMHTLMAAWEKDKFSRWSKPSIDRVSNFLPYTLSNIQLMTARDNIEKNAADIKAGIDTRICKSIRQLSKQGVEICTYYSIQEAVRCNKGKLGFTSTNILHTLQGKQKTSGGYQWEYI